MRTAYVMSWALMLQLLCCCYAPPTTVVPPSEVKVLPATSEGANKSPAGNHLIASGFFNGLPAAAQEGWSRFTQNGQYREAHKDDFNIPEAAMRLYRDDIDRMTAHPYVGGNINRDEKYHDFAVIVVANQRDDAERFGLVIFTQPSKSGGAYETHWLYRNRDLSRTVLEWWSGGLAMREYEEDGSSHHCYVSWDKQARSFSCDKDFKR